MRSPSDYYEVLGVPRDASVTAIKRAYRTLAKRLHPDGTDGAADAFREIQAAYEVLSNAESRRRYDETLGQREARASQFRPIVPGGESLGRAIEPETVSGEIFLTPQEAVSGGAMPLQVPVATRCGACRGTGGAAFDCPACSGEGLTARRVPLTLQIPAGVRDGAVFQIWVDEPLITSLLLTVHIGRL